MNNTTERRNSTISLPPFVTQTMSMLLRQQQQQHQQQPRTKPNNNLGDNINEEVMLQDTSGLRTNKNNNNNNNNHSIGVSNHNDGDLHFTATVSDCIHIPLLTIGNSTPEYDPQYSLERWIASSACLFVLFGSKNVTERSNGLYTTRHDNVKLLGLNMEPTCAQFVVRPTQHEISIRTMDTQVHIVDNDNDDENNDSSSSIGDGGSKTKRTTNRVMASAANIATSASFGRRRHVRIYRDEDDNGWYITIDASMELSIPFQYTIPGTITRVWNRLFEAECRKRTKVLLEDMKNEYEEWVKTILLSSTSTEQE